MLCLLLCVCLSSLGSVPSRWSLLVTPFIVFRLLSSFSVVFLQGPQFIIMEPPPGEAAQGQESLPPTTKLDDEDDEEDMYVVVDMPEYRGVDLFGRHENITIQVRPGNSNYHSHSATTTKGHQTCIALQGLEGHEPRLVIDGGAASFQGRYEESLGTVMVLVARTSKRDEAGNPRPQKPVGELICKWWW